MATGLNSSLIGYCECGEEAGDPIGDGVFHGWIGVYAEDALGASIKRDCL